MKKEINYYKSLLYTKWLENKEYKINLIMGTLANVSLFIAFIIFYSIIGELFLSKLGFYFIDFILFFSLLVFGSFLWRFIAYRELNSMIKLGDFNKVLTLPISPFIFQLPRGLTGSLLAFNLFWFIVLCGVICYNYISLYLIPGILIFLCGFLLQTMILNFIFSLAFFMKENLFIHRLYYNHITSIVEDFTPIPFIESKILKFMLFLPASIYGYLTLITIKGNLEYFYLTISICLIGSLLFAILTIINWKIGLKKYEAYG